MSSTIARQHTLVREITLSGPGLHTGGEIKLTLKPGAVDSGVVFVRTDLEGAPEVPASTHYLRDGIDRRTALVRDQVEVQTVEHLLAGLRGMGLDNVRVELDGPEVPGLDGSAQAVVAAITESGLRAQDALRRVFVLTEAVGATDGPAAIVALPAEDGEFEVHYTLDYPGTAVRGSYGFSYSPEAFATEIAPARTFVLEAEARALLAAGYGGGATTANTLVLNDAGEPRDNTLRFPDEAVRHKVLDVLGDLSLLGVDLRARVYATRTGHRVNAKLVRKLAKRIQDAEKSPPHAPGYWEISEILEAVPHRYPFVMLDRILEMEPHKRAVGLKNVTINEPYFQGHFPDRPVLPGVLLVEALAQLGGLLVLGTGEARKNFGRIAYLIAIDKVRFRRTVRPGDQVRLEVEVVSARARTGSVVGRATVDANLVCEAQIRFMLAEDRSRS